MYDLLLTIAFKLSHTQGDLLGETVAIKLYCTYVENAFHAFKAEGLYFF